MIATIVIGCTAAVLLILVWNLLRSSMLGVDPLQEWRSQNHKVSIDVFRLLVDPVESVFLWESVSRVEFRRLQRKRIALALQCARAMSSNAAILMRVATHARRPDHGQIGNGADQLLFLSFQVWLNALLAEACLFLQWIVPAWPIRIPLVLERYERLLQSCDRLLTGGATASLPARMAG
jgi:hypothetical protein